MQETICVSFELGRSSKGSQNLNTGNEMINANDRMHFHIRSELTEHLRSLANVEARQQVGDLTDEKIFSEEHPCYVIVHIAPPTNRRMDPPNWYPTVKALIDGLTDMGMFSDDNKNIITGFIFLDEPKTETGKYRIDLELCPGEIRDRLSTNTSKQFWFDEFPWNMEQRNEEERKYQTMPDMTFEQEQHMLDKQAGILHSFVAGCDEAGRGPFAGPLVAAAVILPDNAELPEITDSKKINKKYHRTYAEHVLREAVAVGIGVASVEYIDRFGIELANHYAIEEAVKNLDIPPTRILIDGSNQQVIKTDIPQTQIIKGDQKSLSIAAASVVAKSVHDELLRQCAAEFPEYGWEKNAGYGTPDHLRAIEEHGICKYHRKSFKPIKEYLKRQQNVYMK